MNGWIKLHRNIINWEWFDDAETFKLFVYLLLKANHEPRKWMGITVNKGEFVTSISSLSVELNMSVKKIRTRLDKLTQSGEIAVKGANRFTSITICNYDSYQDEEKEKGKQRANKRHEVGTGKVTKRANRNTTTTTCNCDSYQDEEKEKGKQKANKGQTEGHEKGNKQEYKKYKNKEIYKESLYPNLDKFSNYELPEEYKPMIEEWLTYKKERKDKYTERGFKSLCTMIRNKFGPGGEGAERLRQAVIYSSACNYKGIFEPKQNNKDNMINFSQNNMDYGKGF